MHSFIRLACSITTRWCSQLQHKLNEWRSLAKTDIEKAADSLFIRLPAISEREYMLTSTATHSGTAYRPSWLCRWIPLCHKNVYFIHKKYKLHISRLFTDIESCN